MTKRIQVFTLLLAVLALSTFAFSEQKKKPAEQSANAKTTEQAAKATPTQPQTTQEKNIQEYIQLIRSNIRQEKAQVLGAVMQLSAGDAAKFWPIYTEYDNELTSLNKMRSDNVLEYARAYDTMTDAKADELIMKSIDYQKQRAELLAKYYGKMKDSIGAVQAARFAQVEHQLLMLIDLQLASNLPLVEGSEAEQGVKP